MTGRLGSAKTTDQGAAGIGPATPDYIVPENPGADAWESARR
jgi:hypothetical protein